MSNIFRNDQPSMDNAKKLDDLNWGRRNNHKYSSAHSVAPYLAMFSPALPDYFIQKYSEPGEVIMDNFCGRGTTALVARELNRKFVGNDLNPYAYVLSTFKINRTNRNLIVKKIIQLEKEFNHSPYKNLVLKQDQSLKELLYFYSSATLRQLLFLREQYGRRWRSLSKTMNAVLAFALGLMHGQMRVDGSTIYFSLSMPDSISMAPNYVRRYAKHNNLKRPNVNIFQLLINRVNKKYDELLTDQYDGKIYFKDAMKISHHLPDNYVSLVITSPPYLNIINYTETNWLKLWLLGFDRKNLRDIKLSDRFKFDDYITFIKNYLLVIHPKLKNHAKVCLVVGDVYQEQLIEKIWNLVKREVMYKFTEMYWDYNYRQTHKVTNMLNKKAGKATLVEKVLVIEKYGN